MSPSRGAGNATVKLPPAILVRGGDQSLVDSAARAAISMLVEGEESTLGVEDYRAGSTDISSAIDAAQTSPFLTSHRVVVIRDVSQLAPDEIELVTGYLADPYETSTLVLVGGSGTVSTKLDKAVKASGGTVEDASVPSGAKSKSEWLAAKVAEAPVKLDSRARLRLGAHLGEDMDRLEGLLASLASAYGDGAKISREELEPFLGEAGDVPPWDLTDAIDKGDLPGALETLRRMTTAGERHALGVMSVLHRHYLAMLRLDGLNVRSDADAAKALDIKSAFVAGKARNQAARLGSHGIARAITLLADADLDLRGLTGWTPQLVMEVLVARLSRLASQRGVTARN